MDSHYQPLICELSDQTFDPASPPSNAEDYKVRKAARGILIQGKTMALIHMTKNKYYKLPGGGIEQGETNSEGFQRELLEETGCSGTILDQGPLVIEYRDQWKILQLSYVFFAEVTGEIGQVKYEPGELDEGAQLEWIPVQDALALMAKDNPSDYEHKFIHVRDIEILKYYQERLR